MHSWRGLVTTHHVHEMVRMARTLVAEGGAPFVVLGVAGSPYAPVGWGGVEQLGTLGGEGAVENDYWIILMPEERYLICTLAGERSGFTSFPHDTNE